MRHPQWQTIDENSLPSWGIHCLSIPRGCVCVCVWSARTCVVNVVFCRGQCFSVSQLLTQTSASASVYPSSALNNLHNKHSWPSITDRIMGSARREVDSFGQRLIRLNSRAALLYKQLDKRAHVCAVSKRTSRALNVVVLLGLKGLFEWRSVY